MWDYQAAVIEAAELMPTPLALCGWSMGGLVAMMAAQKAGADALVVLEPSPPAELRGDDHDVPLERGTYDPEEEYGPFPSGMAPRQESTLARAERHRGISIPKLPERSLVICGWQFPEVRGRNLAARYEAELVEYPDLDHWQLVLDPKVPEAVNGFLQR
jgi:pimeloyl-ACP methyl ester carboxylesterase